MPYQFQTCQLIVISLSEFLGTELSLEHIIERIEYEVPFFSFYDFFLHSDYLFDQMLFVMRRCIFIAISISCGGVFGVRFLNPLTK